MILDTSAIVAVMLREPDHELLLAKMLAVETLGVGLPTLTETAIVLSSRMREDARPLLARFLDEASVTVVPYGDVHYRTAVDAWLRYGKGRHPAALNFGDCLSYAIAVAAQEPLLFVGDDFGKTDVMAG